MSDLDLCNYGEGHQWRGYDPDEGMTCGGCGVTEAELDHLERQEKRKRALLDVLTGDTE